MNKTILAFATSIIMTFNYCFGQDCSICAEALKHGTTDEFLKETKHSLDESVSTMYAKDYEFWESYEKSNEKSSSFEAAYKVFSASFSSSSSSQEKKESYNKQRSSYMYSRNLSERDFEKVSSKLINSTPYKSFNDCVRDRCSEGLFTSYDIAGNDILLTVRWILKNGDPKQTSILRTLSHSTNVRPINSYLVANETTIKPNNSITATFSRNNPKEKVIIMFSFENLQAQEVTIEGELESSSMPIGTIISSTLSYAEFLSINKLVPSIDYSKVLWVPADGRNVKESKYGKVGNLVPDLRGMFLRGLNQLDPKELTTVTDSLKDPENRKPGHPQNDTFQGHWHSFVSNGHTTMSHRNDIMGQGTVYSSVYNHQDEKHIREDIPATSNPIPDNRNDGLPRTSSETRPKNVAVFYYVRIN